MEKYYVSTLLWVKFCENFPPIQEIIHWMCERAGKQGLEDHLYKKFPNLWRAAYKRFYQDEIWQFVTHKIIFRCVSMPIAWFDRRVIDGTFNFMAWGTNEAGESIRPWQSGDVRQYVVWFLTGAVALTLILLCI